MEIEVPNQGYRLKPGMYARVELTTDSRPSALTLPRAAIVDVDGKPGVFVASGPDPVANTGRPGGTGAVLTARFMPVALGIRDEEIVEISSGITEGTRVITTGALALKDGDRIVASGGRGRRGGDAPANGAREGGGR
jgi:multidrug efflux pump subunit AcrA (membrane-fusion protein)